MTKRSPGGAIFALITAAIAAFAMRKDPQGLGQDRVLRGSARTIGAGGVIWLVWAALKRGLSRQA
ncbi:hypothetical protein [Pseudogemmobacter bohemicus]|uniref:hypothetical protein n=1 Tax=Pseudogemmobacter bohemicus TaxID=2250708 RepID=UPI000DD3551A|nr:hypothetical protein [Pseudogemmobacter bohemicus]